MAAIDQLLVQATLQRASDIHLVSNEKIRFRIDGDLVFASDERMPATRVQELLEEIFSPEEKDRFTLYKNLDKSYCIESQGTFRMNAFMTRNGPAAVFRVIAEKIPSLSDLGLPKVVEDLTRSSKGLILVTGPTGSGKSTTLASFIDQINQNEPCHILTLEDPIEFIHESKISLINQRELGTHIHSFSEALKFALREDPDVILVGEMRDPETISMALTAAETGHLVLGTLHTRTASSSIERIIDSFEAAQQPVIRSMLAESLLAVVSQTLLKRSGGAGRIAAFEILVVNHAVSNLIREGKTFQIPSIIQTGRKEGMISMDQYIQELMIAGEISSDTAMIYNKDISNSSPKSKVGLSAVLDSQTPKTAPALASKKAVSPPNNIKPLVKPAAPTPIAKPAAPPKMPPPIPKGVSPAAAPKPVPPPPPPPASAPSEEDSSGVLVDLTHSRQMEVVPESISGVVQIDLNELEGMDDSQAIPVPPEYKKAKK